MLITLLNEIEILLANVLFDELLLSQSLRFLLHCLLFTLMLFGYFCAFPNVQSSVLIFETAFSASSIA